MGFCTTINPRTGREVLVCDFCGKHPARKIRCPYNYCQAWATCQDCRAAGKHHIASCGGKGTHKEICLPLHIEYVKKQAEDAAVVASGAFVRRAALAHDNDIVRVLFRNKENIEACYHMSSATYHAIPYGVPATPEDYMKHGAVLPVPTTDLYAAIA